LPVRLYSHRHICESDLAIALSKRIILLAFEHTRIFGDNHRKCINA
jgi:hypothetical protein